MPIVHNFNKRKASGGRYKNVKAKRHSQEGDLPTHTKIGEKKLKTKRTLGGHSKKAMLTGNKVNIIDPKTKKAVVAELTNVTENEASRHFVRRNIITKGAVIETSKGKAKVTNRPGQDGSINAVLV